MVLASQLRPGMILKVGDDVLKVVESTYHVGQGKMPGSVHAKLRHVRKGAFKELRWRPEQKLEDTSLAKPEMEFLYNDADSATFMNLTTFGAGVHSARSHRAGQQVREAGEGGSRRAPPGPGGEHH